MPNLKTLVLARPKPQFSGLKNGRNFPVTRVLGNPSL